MSSACLVLAMLRLSAAEWRFALTSFALKVAIFWVAQLVVCMLDPRLMVCDFVEKVFLPCLISFVAMDFLVIPALKRCWSRQPHCQYQPTTASTGVLSVKVWRSGALWTAETSHPSRITKAVRPAITSVTSPSGNAKCWVLAN